MLDTEASGVIGLGLGKPEYNPDAKRKERKANASESWVDTLLGAAIIEGPLVGLELVSSP